MAPSKPAEVGLRSCRRRRSSDRASRPGCSGRPGSYCRPFPPRRSCRPPDVRPPMLRWMFRDRRSWISACRLRRTSGSRSPAAACAGAATTAANRRSTSAREPRAATRRPGRHGLRPLHARSSPPCLWAYGRPTTRAAGGQRHLRKQVGGPSVTRADEESRSARAMGLSGTSAVLVPVSAHSAHIDAHPRTSEAPKRRPSVPGDHRFTRERSLVRNQPRPSSMVRRGWFLTPSHPAHSEPAAPVPCACVIGCFRARSSQPPSSEPARTCRRPRRPADRDDPAVALERHPVRAVGAPEVGRLPAVAGEARVERAVGVVAGEREVAAWAADATPTATILPFAWIATPLPTSRRRSPKSVVCMPSPEKLVSSEPSGCSGRARSRRRTACPTATILPSAWSATSRLVASPEVGRLLAVAGEARVQRAVRVVAGEREVAGAVGVTGRPRRSCRPPGAPRPSAPSKPAEVGRLLAVAGEARVEGAVRGCSARARSRSSPEPLRRPRRSCRRLWSATSDARSSPKRPKSVVCLPSPAKVVSSEPSGL